ncbi:redoxin domain-containing protein [Viscerimonas tarda]
MKKIGLLLPAIVLIMASCADKNAFTLTGDLAEAVPNGKIVYLQKLNDNRNGLDILDSAVINDRKFVFKGIAGATPDLRFVSIPGLSNSDPHIFIVEAGKITMSIDSLTTVAGTPMNNQYQELETKKNGLNAKMKELSEHYRKLLNEGEIAPEENARLETLFDEYIKEMTTIYFEYTKANITNPVGEFFFRNIGSNLEDEPLRELLALARPEFKKAEDIQLLEGKLLTLENTAIGKQFVDLKAKTPVGEDIALSDYAGKGNIVLIDFWASWCAPCRAEMPIVVEAYKKYKDKGFEIVGVSLDENVAAWEKGIKELNITWPQMSDLKVWDSSLSAAYGVDGIPHTVLLDKDGQIIAKNLRGEELLSKLEELLK